jgi:hypothetical protein
MSKIYADLFDDAKGALASSLDATIPDEQRDAARRTVASYATDAAEAAELMRMLGIYPGQQTPKIICTDVTGDNVVPSCHGSW